MPDLTQRLDRAFNPRTLAVVGDSLGILRCRTWRDWWATRQLVCVLRKANHTGGDLRRGML